MIGNIRNMCNTKRQAEFLDIKNTKISLLNIWKMINTYTLTHEVWRDVYYARDFAAGIWPVNSSRINHECAAMETKHKM